MTTGTYWIPSFRSIYCMDRLEIGIYANPILEPAIFSHQNFKIIISQFSFLTKFSSISERICQSTWMRFRPIDLSRLTCSLKGSVSGHRVDLLCLMLNMRSIVVSDCYGMRGINLAM